MLQSRMNWAPLQHRSTPLTPPWLHLSRLDVEAQDVSRITKVMSPANGSIAQWFHLYTKPLVSLHYRTMHQSCEQSVRLGTKWCSKWRDLNGYMFLSPIINPFQLGVLALNVSNTSSNHSIIHMKSNSSDSVWSIGPSCVVDWSIIGPLVHHDQTYNKFMYPLGTQIAHLMEQCWSSSCHGQKTRPYFPLKSWLVNRDPYYNGSWNNPYITG